MSVADKFTEELRSNLEKALESTGEASSHIFIEKEEGATSSKIPEILEDFGTAGYGVWHANCGSSAQILEQLLPAQHADLVRLQKPPRIELAFLSNKGGMNLGTIQRGDSALDPDIISAMMDAVRNFVKDSLAMHTNQDVESKEFEKFEMHGHNFLVYPGELITLTIILSGTITREVLADSKSIVHRIEKTYGERISAWTGSMNELEGMETILSEALLSSRKYEGEWDYESLKMAKDKAMYDFLNIAKSTSAKGKMILALTDIELADSPSLSTIKNILTKTKNMGMAVLLTSRIPEGEPAETFIKGLGEILRVKQPADITLDEFLEGVPDELVHTVRKVAECCAVAGFANEALVSEVCDEGTEKAAAALEILMGSHIIGKDRSMDHYFTGEIMEMMPGDERMRMLERTAAYIEKTMPEEIIHLYHSYKELTDHSDRHRQKAAKFSVAAAEQFTETFRIEDAENAWLSAWKFGDSPEEKLEYLWEAMSFELMRSDYDMLSANAEKMLGLASEIGSTKYQARAYLTWARIDMNTKKFEDAMANIKQAEYLRDMEEGITDKPDILNTKANIISQIGNTSVALAAYRKVAEYSDSLNDYRLKFIALINIGNALRKLEEYDEARETLNQALELADQIDFKRGLSPLLWNLGILAYRENDFDKSIGLCERALSIAQEIGDFGFAVRATTTLMAAHEKIGQMEQAEKYAVMGIELSEISDAGDALALNYNMFETQLWKTMHWLRRTIDIANSGKAYDETAKELRKEILCSVYDLLVLFNEVVDSSGDPDKREKIVTELEKMIEKLGEV